MERAHGQPWRLGPHGQRWFDVALVVALALPAVAFLIDESPAVGTLSLLQTVPLLWRRRHPVAVFAAIALASALQVVVLDQAVWGQAGFPLAVYAVARYATPAWGAAAVATGAVGAVVGSWDWLRGFADYRGAGLDDEGFTKALTAYVLTITTLVVAAWALGALARTRKAYVDALIERGRQVEHDAEQRVALAAQEERARIAREMHDVVAHGLTTIVVQADGARYAAAADPEVTGRALTTISRTGRESLAQMRLLLGLLRSDGTGTSPVPNLADLPELVSGVGVSAQLPPPGTSVPAGIALTTYRIVQEALTNVRKHAGPGARARVAVRVDGAAVEVEVTDDGRGAAAPDDGRGHGLAGMRERVDLHGGTLVTGPHPGGGFAVSARIPL